MRDPYEILGLKRDADEAAIKAAYRKLAKRHHPDLHPGDTKAAERFQELNNANDLLSDPERRARFDRGEIDAEGHEVPPRGAFYRDFHGGPGGERYAGGIAAGRKATRPASPRTTSPSSSPASSTPATAAAISAPPAPTCITPSPWAFWRPRTGPRAACCCPTDARST